jgi:hypothetical protein
MVNWVLSWFGADQLCPGVRPRPRRVIPIFWHACRCDNPSFIRNVAPARRSEAEHHFFRSNLPGRFNRQSWDRLNLLERRVLSLQIPKALHVIRLHARIFALPQVKRRFAQPVRRAHVADGLPRTYLTQDLHHLGIAELRLLNGLVLA